MKNINSNLLAKIGFTLSGLMVATVLAVVFIGVNTADKTDVDLMADTKILVERIDKELEAGNIIAKELDDDLNSKIVEFLKVGDSYTLLVGHKYTAVEEFVKYDSKTDTYEEVTSRD